MSDTTEYYEYKLTSTNDDEIDPSRRYFFTKATAKDHNLQYALNGTPRRLMKVRKGNAMVKPSWWSGNLSALPT